MFVSLLGSTMQVTSHTGIVMKSMGKDRIMNWSGKYYPVLQLPNTFKDWHVKDWSTCCSYQQHDANHLQYHRGPGKWFPNLGFENLWGGLFLVLFLLHRWTVCTSACHGHRQVGFFSVFPPFPIPAVSRGVRPLFTDGRGGRFGMEFRSVAWIKSITGDAVPLS